MPRKTPPSAKQHYMKQARYFPGQNINNTQTYQAVRNPAALSYGKKGSHSLGNAMGGTTYVPSFGGGAQTTGTFGPGRIGGMQPVFSQRAWIQYHV